MPPIRPPYDDEEPPVRSMPPGEPPPFFRTSPFFTPGGFFGTTLGYYGSPRPTPTPLPTPAGTSPSPTPMPSPMYRPTPGDEDPDATQRLHSLLKSYGLDPNHPDIARFLASLGSNDTERLRAIESNPNVQSGLSFLAVQLGTDYISHLIASGLERRTPPEVTYETRGHPRGRQFPDMREALAQRGPEPYQYSSMTGYMLFHNGTLVTPDGQVIYAPDSMAPGSPQWIRHAVATWDKAEIQRWREKLHRLGYLPKSALKVEGFDAQLITALEDYHTAYYRYGGAEIPVDEAAAAGAGAGKPPPFDFSMIQNQIYTSVLEQFRQVYGTDPEESEVRAWTQFVMRQAMRVHLELRKKGIMDPGLALTEAEEAFRRKLEEETAPYREAVEENTTLRDGLIRAAQAMARVM